MVAVLDTITYGPDGMRTSRSNGTTTWNYVYNGSQLMAMTNRDNTISMYFTYDAAGRPVSIEYNGTTYYYVLNVQGDVVTIVNSSGSPVVNYTYNAWGKLCRTTGSMTSTLGTYNPLRYRGYVYDTDTGLYYLQSRYYNPEMGRFINADSYASTGQGIIGCNMFAYCLNNPVLFMDGTGSNAEAATLWTTTMWWLCGVDTILPIGDLIYGMGILVSALLVVKTTNKSITTSDATSLNQDLEEPNDDYFDDEQNFGGKKKIGRNNGNTPRDNKKQNKQIDDLTRHYPKNLRRQVHKIISHQGYGYKEIEEIIKDLSLIIILIFGLEGQD